MKQKVHNIAYLAVVTLPLVGLTKTQAVAFPQGAEIMDVSLEVVEAGDSALTCDLGLEGGEDIFANDIDLSVKGHHNSSVKHTCVANGSINITLNKKATMGKVKVRALYYLPSTILAEY